MIPKIRFISWEDPHNICKYLILGKSWQVWNYWSADSWRNWPQVSRHCDIDAIIKQRRNKTKDDPRLRYWSPELPCSIQRYTVYRMFSTKVPVTRVSISRFHRFFFGGWHGCPNLLKIGFQTTSLCGSQPWLWQVIELQPNLHHFQKWSTRRCFSNVCYCYFSYLIIYYTLRHAYLSHACFRKHHNKPGVGGFVNFSPFLNQIHSLSQLDMARKSSPNLLRVQETARSDLKDLRFLDQCLDRPHCMSVGWHHKGKL